MGIDYMNGWDLMIATFQTNINQALTTAYNAGELPHTIDEDFTITTGGQSVSANIDGNLGPWTIAWGAGQAVVVTIPITSGTLTISSLNLTIPLNNVGLQVTLTNLTTSLSGTEVSVSVTVSTQTIESINVQNPPGGLNLNDFTSAIETALVQALGGKPFTVVTVDMGSSDSFLVPTLCNYALGYNTAPTTNPVFALLLMTVNATAGSLTVTPGTVPACTQGCTSAILISNQILMQYFFLPAAAKTLGVSQTQLQVTQTGTTWTVTNNGSFSLPVGGKYTATITAFSASVGNDLLNISFTGSIVPSAGITVKFTDQSSYQILIQNANGSEAIELSRVGDNKVTTETEYEWWVWAAIFAGFIAGPIVGAVVAVISAGVLGVLALVLDSKAGDGINTKVPALINAIQWSHMQQFVIQQAFLPTPLQLGGSIPSL